MVVPGEENLVGILQCHLAAEVLAGILLLLVGVLLTLLTHLGAEVEADLAVEVGLNLEAEENQKAVEVEPLMALVVVVDTQAEQVVLAG